MTCPMHVVSRMYRLPLILLYPWAALGAAWDWASRGRVSVPRAWVRR